MKATVSKRDLNQHTAQVLERLAETDDLVIVVTERGKPRWSLSTYRETETGLTRLEREGHYTPPSDSPAPWPEHPGGPRYTGADVDALLDEMKGDH